MATLALEALYAKNHIGEGRAGRPMTTQVEDGGVGGLG